MSLKVFHVFFISMSALMCSGIGFWRASEFMASGGAANAGQATASLLAAVGLIVYGVQFLRKFKNLGYL